MTQFILAAYCTCLPLLFLLSFFGRHQWKNYGRNLLAVNNHLLMVYSFFLFRQLLGLLALLKKYSLHTGNFSATEKDQWLIIRLCLLILLPFLSIHKKIGSSPLFSLLLWLLICSLYPLSMWSDYGLLFKVLNYFCLLCMGYSLLWLLRRLPFQTHTA